MSWKARSGLILATVLFLAWLGHQKLGHIPTPPKQEKVATKATMKEKRENREIAKAYAQAGWGWQGREWKCLEYLWSSESRFDHYADNPESTAFGIAQRLGERSTNPRIQILKGLRYVSHRHDTPCKAWAFWLKRYHY
jgi:hypothetical protein